MSPAKEILKWNATWTFDYWWRKKYNVAFNSEQHRSISQIDIKMDRIEDYMAAEAMDKYASSIKDKEEFEKGKWIKERISDTEDKKLFEKINLSEL